MIATKGPLYTVASSAFRHRPGGSQLLLQRFLGKAHITGPTLLLPAFGCSKQASQTVDPATLKMFSQLLKDPPPAGSLTEQQIALGRMDVLPSARVFRLS